ncbi:MAG TPA: hypothetical protein VHE32_08655 [Rhodanobacteraceae bacterium]|nr:hypothetical protein [Rhodanobacteraceae bacterium]
MNAVLFAIFVAVSLPAFGIGHYARSGRHVEWISGVRREDTANPEGFARFVGSTMYGIGAVCVASGIALAFAPSERQAAIGIAFVAAANLLVALLIAGIFRHKRRRRER